MNGYADDLADMYVLTAEPSLYDEMGAFARACESLAQEDLRQHRARLHTVLELAVPTPEQEAPEEVVAKEAINWEVDQPGITIVYERALKTARADGRWKYHWSGLGGYPALAEYVARKQGAPKGFKEAAAFWYRLLTHHSHPGLRTGSRAVHRDTPGRIIFGPKELTLFSP
jgi:hypothetical protein